ncbi:PLP-dependent transferase [Atractiella rhizophila]|nr:PLP-dependent transferase [Atractiella rhizophila]
MASAVAVGGGRGTALKTLIRSLATLENAKSVTFYYLLWIYFGRAWRHVRGRGVRRTVVDGYEEVIKFIFNIALRVPKFRRSVHSQLAKAQEDLERQVGSKSIPFEEKGIARVPSLPEEGKSNQWIDEQLDKLVVLAGRSYLDGKASGAVYHGGEDMSNLILDSFKKFNVSNPLHPNLFPGIRKMEAEVVSMVLSLFNAPPNGAGTTTSGGTESILMACKAYREWGKKVKGITEPEMVLPESAHAAFLKAGKYFGIKCVLIPADKITRKVDLRKVKRAINKNTVMLVGSAPNYGDGIIDDIPALSLLATKYGLPLHVDCCLGSFLVPFLERAGYPSEPFDFRIEGVTSISCDTHKLLDGFAPKGSSVILYRDLFWRHFQYFATTTWPGGVYASPSIAGSRPGNIIAGAWAAMVYMGQSGYLESCKNIVGAAKAIEKGIRETIPELYVLGKPLVSVVAFGSDTVSIHQVVSGLQNPPAVHIACTRLTVPVVDEFLQDLRDCIDEVKASPISKGTMTTLYGMGSTTAVGPVVLEEICTRYLDVVRSFFLHHSRSAKK